MRMFRIRRGVRFNSKDGQLWSIDRILYSGKILLITEQGAVETLSRRELLRRWLDEDWAFDQSCLPAISDAALTATARDLSAYTEAEIQRAQDRFAYIAPFVEARRVADSELDEHAKIHAHKVGTRTPCAKTLRRWLVLFKIGRDITALIDRKSARGPESRPVIDRIFEQALTEAFMHREHPNSSDALNLFETLVEKHNVDSVGELRIKPWSRATFYRRMQDIDVIQTDRARLGRFEANKKNRTGLAHAKARCILDRVEVDHTQLDIFLIDEATGEALGRPWLTVAIDVYSKMIVGLHLTFDPPSAHSVLQCLKFAILPKDKLNEEFPDLQNDWPVAGTFTTLVFDNSLDAHGGRLKNFCLAIGASIHYCPSRTPWFKGTVERYFRTQNTGVLHRLPGTTFSNSKERADYPSEELCRFERKQFWHLLLRWVMDVYHVTPHRTTGMPPIERWRRNSASRDFDFPVSPGDLQIMTARSTERQLQHYGIDLNHLKYNSAALQDIYRQLSARGGRRGSTTAIEVRHYDDTVAYVDVLDPIAKVFVRVPALDQEYTKNLDLFTHLLVHRNLNREFGRKWRLPDRRRAIEDIRAMVAVAGEKKRKLTRQLKRTERAERTIDQLVRRQKAKDKAKTQSQKHFRSRPDAALPELLPLNVPHLSQEPPHGG